MAPTKTLDGSLLTIVEVAGILRLGRSATYELVRSGELASVRVGKRAVRVRPQAVAEFISARESKVPA